MSKKESEEIKLTQFEQTVQDLSSWMPQFPKTVAGRQIFLMADPASLHVINSLFEMFRKRYKVVNEAEALSLVSLYFMKNVKDEIDEEV